MSKAEMSVHYIKPDSLRLERANLSLGPEDGRKQVTVVTLICESEDGDEFRLQMFMDNTAWRTKVEVDVAGLKIVGTEEDRLSPPVVEALCEYLDYLENAHIGANGRAGEAQSCERAEEVRLLIVSGTENTEEGGVDDGAQDQEQEQG